MAAEIPEGVRKALKEPQFWHLATLNPDGSPHSTTMWVDERDGNILVNSALGRRKPRNLERDARVALSWHNPDSPYNSAAVQGLVVDSYTGERADADIDSLAKKYLGQDTYPFRQEGEQRITFVIEPSHVLDATGD
jgi:PPOX class probable F420-dependent enzyme